MPNTDFLRYLTDGYKNMFDFSSSYSSSLYESYLIEVSSRIDTDKLRSDWKNIEKDIFHSILRLALEDADFQQKLLEVMTEQQHCETAQGLENEK
ncbi:hypothetical protein [Solidesulfovibrio sp.]|uniref:hypothetical protein n=1 Tax=Solidesulfovibrio sp. TaxID=2910990 RepID=UPI002607E20E|nr:hypothetical protein [Solidesulfovibrio sp.]